MPITIKVRATGPYFVDADKSEINLIDHLGNPIPIPETGKRGFVLCRCGASTTKPFCDNTHSKVGFLAADAAVRQEKTEG